MGWSDLIAPAIELAERGLRVDWYSSLKIASAARDLSRFPSSKALFLPDGQAPVGQWGGPLPVIELKALQQTLQRLAVEGAESFYRGSLAEDIVRDASLLGMKLGIDDLKSYTPVLHAVDGFTYRTSLSMRQPASAPVQHCSMHWVFWNKILLVHLRRPMASCTVLMLLR